MTDTQQSRNANGSDEQASPSVQPPAPGPRLSLWRHVKTGALYEILAHAKMESNGEPVVVYRGESGTWVRDAMQFYDGRFASEPPMYSRAWWESLTPERYEEEQRRCCGLPLESPADEHEKGAIEP